MENMENTININGKTYQKLGDISTINGIYTFAYDESHVDFTMTKDGNIYDNNGRYSLKENINPITNGVNIPLLTEKVVFSNLCTKIYNMIKSGTDLKKVSLYISSINDEISEISETMNIKFDFSTQEKAKETEKIFQDKCIEIATIIDEKTKLSIETKNLNIDANIEKTSQLANKTLIPASIRNRAAFVDVIILCVVAQLTIFLTVLAVLFVMNR